MGNLRENFAKGRGCLKLKSPPPPRRKHIKGRKRYSNDRTIDSPTSLSKFQTRDNTEPSSLQPDESKPDPSKPDPSKPDASKPDASFSE